MTAFFLQKQQNSQKRNPQHFLLLLLLFLMVTIINFADAMLPIGDAALQTVTAMTTLEEIPNSRVVEQRRQDHENRQFLTALRLRALQNLQRSLESLTTLTANSLMLNAALQSSESIEQEDPLMMQQEHDGADELFEMATSTMMPTTMPQGDGQQQQNLRHQHRLSSVLDHRRRRLSSSSSTSASSSQHSSAGVDDLQQQVMRIRPQRHGIRRLRADLKKMPPNSQEEEQQQQQEGKEGGGGGGGNDANANGGPTGGNNSGERPRNLNSRRMRSTSTTKHHGHHHHGSHKRRRKGCPSVHGKDQLLCPTRNTHRYDVCITREQLCDRIRDCPGGEDEDSRHCFFFRPLESSLKTISHAVLLLVDTVMREQEEHQQQRQQMDRNEL